MNEKTKKFLSGAVFLSLVFGFAPMVSAGGEAVFNSANQAIRPFVKIEVITARPALEIATAGKMQTAESQTPCQQGTAAAQTLVQDQALVNLNQPSGCFDLAVGSLPQNLTQLSVKSFVSPAPKIVVLPFAKIAKVLYQNSPSFPASAGNAIPPIAAAVVFLISAISLISLKPGRRTLISLKQALNLEQLQVMRC